MLRKAVFLNNNGTLIENVPHNVDPNQMLLTPGAAEGLRLLHQAGYSLIVISNQPGVALGYFSEVALQFVIHRLRGMLSSISVPLGDFYYCPHHPQGKVAKYARPCACRKPAPGLIFRAAFDHTIDLSHSWCIGDILDDIEAGRRAGCRTLLIDNGNETEWLLTPERQPGYIAGDLAEAAQRILLDQRYANVAMREVL